MISAEAQAERRRLEGLMAEATYAREQYRLYRAKIYGPRPASPVRLLELERSRNLAEARLGLAQHKESPR